LAICLAAPTSIAAPAELRVLMTDPPTPAARETLAALMGRFPAITVDKDARRLVARPGPSVHVALGAEALKALLEAGSSSPLLTLLSSNELVRATISAANAEHRRPPITAIFAEAAPAQQLMLIRMIFRRQVSVGVLLTENTAHIEPQIRSGARNVDLDVDILRMERGDNPIRAINRLASKDVLLAVPDRAIFSPENVQSLLEATYRRGQAVVGFSSALVRAGTLASVYSTVDEVVAQASMLIEQLANGQQPGSQYPIYWRVTVNENVARSMNIPVDNEARGLASPVR
jgi:hypothetical protein